MKINSENAYEYDGVRSGDTKMSEIIPAKAIEDHEIYCRSVRITVIREDLDRHIASQKITLECLKERARTESNPALPKAIEGLEYAIYMLSQLNAESSDQDHIDARQISGDASRYINANCYR